MTRGCRVRLGRARSIAGAWLDWTKGAESRAWRSLVGKASRRFVWGSSDGGEGAVEGSSVGGMLDGEELEDEASAAGGAEAEEVEAVESAAADSSSPGFSSSPSSDRLGQVEDEEACRT
jgi:hypothetical protein